MNGTTSILAVGIDILEPERLMRRLADNPALRNELFHLAELSYCDSTPNPSQHLAGRFCAKEAAMKALALEAWEPLDVEIVGDGGKPAIRLYGGAKARAESLAVQVSISISHLPTLAIAIAVAYTR